MSVEPAVEAADGAGRHPALDVELEEAGAAVGAAEEPLVGRAAAAKPAHGSRPSDDGAVECTGKHGLFDVLRAACPWAVWARIAVLVARSRVWGDGALM